MVIPRRLAESDSVILSTQICSSRIMVLVEVGILLLHTRFEVIFQEVW